MVRFFGYNLQFLGHKIYFPISCYSLAGLSHHGGRGASPLIQFLAEQLTLSQQGGKIMPTTVLSALPDFQTLQRPLIHHREIAKISI